MFDEGYLGNITSEEFMLNSRIHPQMPQADLRHLLALYDGEIRFTDESLGKIIDHLRQLGVYNDTITAVTSDHGEEFFEHGNKGHRQNLYNDVLLIPLVVRYPERYPAGTVVEEVVRLIDVGPTLLRLADIDPLSLGISSVPQKYKGRDLTPLIVGIPQDNHPRLAFSTLDESRLVAVRGENVKLLVRTDGNKIEVYDVEIDPAEKNNLAGERREEVTLLLAQLVDWQKTAAVVSETDTVRKSLGEIEVLRSLGYIK
jgi:arylsulfatase A-like enzyme